MLFKFSFPSQIAASRCLAALPSRGSFWSVAGPDEHGGLVQGEKRVRLKPGPKLLSQESQEQTDNLREIPGTGK